MSFTDFQQQINANRQASEAKRLELKTARQVFSNVSRQKNARLREVAIDQQSHDARLNELQDLEVDATTALADGKTAYIEALGLEWQSLLQHLQFTNPVDNIGALSDEWPILLFPLRLETRFKKVQRNGAMVDQLWVRVYPDDIAINSFESDLSDTEVHNTQRYWQARWAAGKQVDANRAAWRALAATHGPGRAYWLTQKYVPLNIADEPELADGEVILAIATDAPLVDPELSALNNYWQAVWRADKDADAIETAWNQLLTVISQERAETLIASHKPSNLSVVPPTGHDRQTTTVRVLYVSFESRDDLEAKLHGWSQPPTTSILPERLALLTFQDDEEALPPQIGELIPPNLVLGPDPAAEEGEEFRLVDQEEADADPDLQEGDLIFAENMRWMFDFEEAVSKGMGFKVDLTAEQAETGFDRLFILGVKLGADKDKAQEMLEDLISQHQNSRKGFAILQQGMPTNNTEDDDSAYTWRHDPDDSFDLYFSDSLDRSDPNGRYDKRDGRWLADTLGIQPEKLHTVENYYNTDVCEAKAMQQALWPATLGHFMDSMMNPIFDSDAIENTRQFFMRYVSGRGNLPAIRVGKQPYGILPVTRFTQMRWFDVPSRPLSHVVARSSSEDHYLSMLYRILLDMDSTWMQLQNRAAYVGKSGDPQQLLLDIVGLHPNSVEISKRYANTIKQLHNIYNAEGFAHPGFFSYFPTSYLAAATLLARYGYSIGDKNPEPDILKKSFFEDAYILNGARIDNVPNSETDAIGIYTSADQNYIEWLIEAAEDSHDRLRQQADFLDDKRPTALLYLLMYHALDLSYIDTSLKLHLSKDVMTAAQVKQAYIEPDFIHIEQNNETESRWKYLYKADDRITGDADIELGRYIPQNLATLTEAAVFRDVLAGLKKLAKVPTARLERAMIEHIDTVSYRYDAWMMGFVNMQLEFMRDLNNVENEAKQGVYIGAYGWLEDVRSENKELTTPNLSDDLNAFFNPDDDLVEDSTNAGYVLAPSQNHAITAAVLRNAHLPNEQDGEDQEALNIKLSSERVRLALQIIEGIQGGQSLAALLGYRFERGLHDRTDAEVDQYIFDLRNAFPLVAKKFKATDPDADDDYDSIAQIEARNVIDGSALLQHIEKTGVKTYPFDKDGLEPIADTNARLAINDEVQKLIDVNDAVADLALAESVHQVVMGNYERAAATLDTYSKGNYPPTPDVIKTPRSGIQLTHRVALQFRSGLSHVLGDPGVTPRMFAEPAMHDWLATVMPDMNNVECIITYTQHSDGTPQELVLSLADLGLAAIDALYLLDIDNDQAMSAVDDLIMAHVLQNLSPRMTDTIKIEYTRKQGASSVSVFEFTALVAELRRLLLRSKALNAADVRLANEAAKEQEQSVSLNANRIEPLTTALTTLSSGDLSTFIADVDNLITAADTDAMVTALDTAIDDIRSLFLQAARYGLSQSGIGFVYQWQQGIYTQLYEALDDVITRWQRRVSEYNGLINDYTSGIGSLSDAELFAILTKAELKISSDSTVPPPATPAAYFSDINSIKFTAFITTLNDTLLPLKSLSGLTPLIQALQLLPSQLAPFDIATFGINKVLDQVKVFMQDLHTGAGNLHQEIQDRANKATDLLNQASSAGSATARVDAVRQAGQAIFGDNFVMVPEFTVDSQHASEWHNTLNESEHSLRYLHNDLDMDFPVDDWFYGVSRVREKMSQLERAMLHIEGLREHSLSLQPCQFPYRVDDCWLGLKFPDKKPGTDEDFVLNEDKLLLTSIYSETFDAGKAQCGLLLDEWTEVIPSKDETLGLSFHYDQPNSEPPQTLLLVTPSEFTQAWTWDDLVGSLHETLDMAKKRAVEPDHIDDSIYSRFLPSIVSPTSPLPLTATLNLAINNQVFFAEVSDDD